MENLVIFTTSPILNLALIALVYTELVGKDDAGAVINEREDKLWKPSKPVQKKQSKKMKSEEGEYEPNKRQSRGQ